MSKVDQTASNDELPFEEILNRLQHVVEHLEAGEIPLEESLKVFEEGIRLSRLGAQKLDEAERRVQVLLADEQKLELRSLDDAESALREREVQTS